MKRAWGMSRSWCRIIDTNRTSYKLSERKQTSHILKRWSGIKIDTDFPTAILDARKEERNSFKMLKEKIFLLKFSTQIHCYSSMRTEQRNFGTHKSPESSPLAVLRKLLRTSPTKRWSKPRRARLRREKGGDAAREGEGTRQHEGGAEAPER